MKFDSTTVLLIVAAIVVAGGGYWFFAGGTEEPPLSAGTQNEAQTRFKLLVSQLKPISFDTDIFSNPNFMALVDLATPITPETSGRVDPFASLSGASGT